MTPHHVNRMCLGLLACAMCVSAHAELDLKALPETPDGFTANFFVKEPHIINPASLCFDKDGRLYVGAGPQYRNPKTDSPTDYIKILIDGDDDGVAETIKTFAEGFNCIESLAWRGDELWVANSPELTVVRDTDGDDVADEYTIIYTGLNNLRHGLHGLNWGPDGWLYMTIGNTWVKDSAPLPFRQLQGNESEDATVYPLTETYTKEAYKKSFHSLKKAEKEGGIFRCRPGGYDLELWARGMRNPWDACFDASFNWLATDNDPGPQRDRIFMPLQYAHYTMRHPWLFDWMGESLAVAPASKLFQGTSGSGTGVEFYMAEHFPAAYRNTYLIADWTNHKVSFYKPQWDGALQVPDGEMIKLADSGRNTTGDLKYTGAKGKSLFRPTDVKIGPAGDVYIAGWGSVYGTDYVPASKWTEEENAKYQGRVFRIRHENPLISRQAWYPKKRSKDITTWSVRELMDDMGHQMEVWRVNAQNEIVRRGKKVRKHLIKAIDSGKQNESQQTWSIWALGRIDAETGDSADIINFANGKKGQRLNLQIQAVRILGENKVASAIDVLITNLEHPEPRVRLAAIQSLEKTGFGDKSEAVLQALAHETDRSTLYTGWQVLRRELSQDARRALLQDSRSGVRLMAMLSLMEDRAATAVDILELSHDDDDRIRTLASQWQAKTGNRADQILIDVNVEQPKFRSSTQVTLKTTKGLTIHYTLDGAEPSAASATYTEPLTITESAILRAAAFFGKKKHSDVSDTSLHRISDNEWKDRLFVRNLKINQGKHCTIIDDGLQRGVSAYEGASTTIIELPQSVAGATQLRLHKDDNRSSNNDYLAFDINIPATLYVAYDARYAPPAWVSEGFTNTGEALRTSAGKNGDEFKIYRKAVDAGTIVLGGPAHRDAKEPAMIHVFLTKAVSGKTDIAASTAALATADITRGEELFFGRGTCFACHKMQGKGLVLGPDLNDIAKRRDMKYVIESILQPDVYIVEGFQQTSLEMKNGATFFGMVQEDTAESVTLYLATGEKIVVRTSDVAKRDDAKVSGMPSSFAYTLTPQDVADVSEWLIKR
jgi:putative membrane-bound dehydrogenase-like protein